jgi:2,5-furandicarboxylate decarboxylase 1
MDLRTFLSDLEKAGELLHIRKSVNPRFLSALTAQSKRGVYFSAIQGYDMPVAAGLVSTLDRLAIGMHSPKEALGRRLAEAVQRPISPVVVKQGSCQEVILAGEEVDLTRLPLPLQGELDGGPYISAGMTIARDPEYGRNAGFYRFMYSDPMHLAIGLTGPSDLRLFYQRALSAKRPVPMAVAIGTHPSDMVAVTYKAPVGCDELAIAGGLRGEPLELVRCRTIDAEAPADAEIVLECEILPTGFTVDEGRFGEFTRFMGGLVYMPLVQVKAITHRKNAIFQVIHMPWENIVLDMPAYEAIAWNILTMAGIETRAINITSGGCGQFHVVAAIKKRGGEGKNALLALLSAASFKYAVVVDDDIDVFDPDQVEWAMFSRVQADRDVVIIPDARAKTLDPSLPPVKPPALPLGAKLGIDATIPEYADRERYATITYPFMNEVRLGDYLD